MTPWTLFFLLAGCCVGSFLNVCIYRLPGMRGVVWPGSRCPHCLAPIRPWDNIPVVSWFVLGGKCRDCGAAFSIRYALIELLTGTLFALFFWGICIAHVRGQALACVPFYLFVMYLVSTLIAASFIDFDHKVIPDAVTVPAMGVALAASFAWPWLQTRPVTWPAPHWLAAHAHWQGLVTSLWGMVVGAGSIWIVRVLGRLAFRKEAMGFGDVVLMGAIGAFVGWQTSLVVFFLAPFFGLVVGLVGFLTRRQHVLPYGPYLSLATVVLVFGGDLVWPWLQRRFPFL